MDNASLSSVSALMLRVPDAALHTEVLFARIETALVEAVGISHGFWRGICPSLSSKVSLETDSPPFITWVMVSDE